MAKIKLTKNELKKQRDSLKQYLHYLPTLQLKKQQLKMTILQAKILIDEKLRDLKVIEEDINQWIVLLADSRIDLKKWILPVNVAVDTVNIAGANVPLFYSVNFEDITYDLYTTPFWVDEAIEELRWFLSLFVEVEVIKKQIAILDQELRVTNQRVNLFEKVKIPECLENIRMIRIYLGDQQANAVGISKVAKKKIEALEYEEVAA